MLNNRGGPIVKVAAFLQEPPVYFSTPPIISFQSWQKWKNSLSLLLYFVSFVQEKRSDAKYCMSFLDSTETTAKKGLRDMYKSWTFFWVSFSCVYITCLEVTRLQDTSVILWNKVLTQTSPPPLGFRMFWPGPPIAPPPPDYFGSPPIIKTKWFSVAPRLFCPPPRLLST